MAADSPVGPTFLQRLDEFRTAAIVAGAYDPTTGEFTGGGGGGPARFAEGSGSPVGVVDKPPGWLYFDKENGGLYASAIFVWQADRPYGLGELAHQEGATYESLEADNEGHEPEGSPEAWKLVVGEPHGTENWVAVGGSTDNTGLGLGIFGGTTHLIAEDQLVLSLLNGVDLTISKVAGATLTTGLVLQPPLSPELLAALLIETPEGWNEYPIKTQSRSGPIGESHPGSFYVTSDGAIHSEGFGDQHAYGLSINLTREGTWTMASKPGVIAAFSQRHAAGESTVMGYVLTVDAGGGVSVWDGETEGAEAEEEEAEAIGGHRLWWVTPDGYEATRNNAPPNDEHIKPGQLFSWFDATNGDAKFIRRGRTLDGTLVEAVSKLA